MGRSKRSLRHAVLSQDARILYVHKLGRMACVETILLALVDTVETVWNDATGVIALRLAASRQTMELEFDASEAAFVALVKSAVGR